MGQCCGGRQFLTDNEGENFMRDIIRSLKIRNFMYEDVSQAFTKCIKIERQKSDLVIKEYHIFVEDDYELFIKTYFFDNEKSVNSCLNFHQNLSPSYNEIVEDTNFTYNFSVYALSLIFGSNRELLVHKVLQLIEDEKMTFSFFKTFLSKYLRVNLINFTQKINETLQKTKDSDVILNRVIDKHLKNACEDLLKNKFNQEKVSIFESNLVNFIEGILKNKKKKSPKKDKHNKDNELEGGEGKKEKHKKKELTDLSDKKITVEHLAEIVETHPWLFDCLELRNHFYELNI